MLISQFEGREFELTRGHLFKGLGNLYNKFIPFFKSSQCKIASMARNRINSVPQTAATTFAFSSVVILLLWGDSRIASNWEFLKFKEY